MQENNETTFGKTPFAAALDPMLYSITLMTKNKDDENPDGHMYNYVGVAKSKKHALEQGLEQIKRTNPALAELARVFGGFEVVCSISISKHEISRQFAKFATPMLSGITPPAPDEKHINVINAMLNHILVHKDRETFKALRPFLNQFEITMVENSLDPTAYTFPKNFDQLL